MPPKIAPFLFEIIDEDKKVFTVVGPMMDDTPWIKRIAKAQAEHRIVRGGPVHGKSREEAVEFLTQFWRYTCVDLDSMNL